MVDDDDVVVLLLLVVVDMLLTVEEALMGHVNIYIYILDVFAVVVSLCTRTAYGQICFSIPVRVMADM